MCLAVKGKAYRKRKSQRSPAGREPRIAARRPRTLPPARRHAQRAGLLVVADRVVDARVVVRLTLGEGVEAAAALDGHELERRLDERLGFSCR